jgi:hypothetical protein
MSVTISENTAATAMICVQELSEHANKINLKKIHEEKKRYGIIIDASTVRKAF